MGADLVMAAAAGPSLPLLRLWDRLRRRMAAMAAGESAGRGRAADREAVNRQAERMLTDYGGSVLRLAYSYLHNLSDAEEVLQDTLIRFLRTAPALESAAHERAWLLRAAANLSKNRLRYNRVRRTDELNEELAAEEREDLSFVWEAVRDLPVKYREVIHLFYHEGYSTAQIAGILDRKEATVRSDLRRGREKLREVLKEAYDF
nr:sigma-70 family RNA polymerase sigma factor [uncultured Oscillibacter sp.]